MIPAPLPPDETARLQALRELAILDTGLDPVLEGLLGVATRALGCPIGAISLVDETRQWFKAVRGLALRETPREHALCAHAILSDELLVVRDARADVRFADNPLVLGEPGIRFYAGVPIGTPRHRLGALCVVDRVARDASAAERELLAELGRVVDQWLAARAERVELADREQAFRELAEQTPAIVYRAALDRYSSTRYISPRLADLGYDPQAWVDEPRAWYEAVHPDDRPGVRAMLDELSASRRPATMHFRMRDAEGRWRHMQNTARVISPTSGVDMLQGVMLDVTESMAQQDRLRMLSAAVDQAAESVFITDLKGTIEYVNEAAVCVTGYARDELLGRNPRMLQSGQTPATVYGELWSALRAGRSWKGVLQNRRKNGSALVESATISPVHDAAGRRTHYLAVKEDITENRDLRRELEQYRDHLDVLVAGRTAALDQARAAAEAASTAKSAFLASMSHEIRTPMNGVIGVIELLERSSLTPEQKDLTETARESAAALLMLIDDILDFSKIEAGRMTLEAAPFDPGQVTQLACEALQPVAAARGVDLHVFADPALPAQLQGDALRVRQIVTNLVGNAVKFSAGLARPGRVTLRAGWQAGSGLVLSVTDNGIGISAPVQARLFQPFEQAERSTTRKYGGSGLGLVICRRLVDAMGGQIELESAPDEGSRFTVRLPLPAAGPPAMPGLPAPSLEGLRCRLVVGDEEWAQDWSAYLRAAGAEVRRDPVVQPDADPATVWVVQAELAAESEIEGPSVWLRRGERRTPREESPRRVALDAPGFRREALSMAVAMAAGRVSALDTCAVAQPDSTGLNGTRVLVAEDNATNRKVIARQLRLLGVVVDLAEDGREALEMWRRATPYDLVLTDLHMPHVDGYALCAAIRSEETGGRRLPIIALTANTLRGEAERCRAAGMDDYLCKPVQIDRLRTLLLTWRRAPPPAGPATRQEPPAAALRESARDFDPDALRKLLGTSEPRVIDELQQEYLRCAQRDLAQLMAAVRAEDWQAATGVAHRWKSGSRAVGAVALGQALEEIELAGRQSNAQAVREIVPTVAAALAAARECMRSVAAGADLGDTPRVIVVDDDPCQLRQLGVLLADVGPIATESYAGGAAMLSHVSMRHSRNCLALIDLNMPDMDGIELVRHLAETGYQGALALFSGTDRRLLETAARLAKARGLRVLGHLRKPVGASALRRLLDRWQEAPAPQTPRATPARSAGELRAALERGELRVMYQPQVDLRSGELDGVEALVRWAHPQDGLLPPGAFIPVAEEHGLIDRLTDRVLEMALRQSRAWRDEHDLAVRVAVNVSMDNLVNLDFPDRVLAALHRHGLAAADLVLEVTETRLMKDLRAPLDILTRLRLRGVGLSIDDFGTGHSSLAQLRDLPFDELKVDQGFVHGGRRDPTLRAILTGSVEMAQQLGMRIVAEGVEDPGDWDLVGRAGCTVAQGYAIGRPMPGEELPGWLQRWPARREGMLAALTQ